MLYNWGEPFLHKDIIQIINYAHQKRIATALSSNLNILPKEGAESVVRSGLDDLIISCDGLTQETYERYRKGGTLEKVFSNLRAIKEAKKKLASKTHYIEFQFLVFEHNEHEVPDVEAKARELGADFVRIMPPFVGENDVDIRPARSPEFRKPPSSSEELTESVFEPGANLEAMARHHPPPLNCFWPWRSMVINWNGQVDPCCFKNYHEEFGNVFQQPVSEIWNNDVYRYARRWISGRATEEPPFQIVCRGCPGYH